MLIHSVSLVCVLLSTFTAAQNHRHGQLPRRLWAALNPQFSATFSLIPSPEAENSTVAVVSVFDSVRMSESYHFDVSINNEQRVIWQVHIGAQNQTTKMSGVSDKSLTVDEDHRLEIKLLYDSFHIYLDGSSAGAQRLPKSVHHRTDADIFIYLGNSGGPNPICMFDIELASGSSKLSMKSVDATVVDNPCEPIDPNHVIIGRRQLDQPLLMTPVILNPAPLARSCAELARIGLGKRDSGLYTLELPGGHQVEVGCQFSSNGGTTLIDHNFPNATIVRGQEASPNTYSVEYRLGEITWFTSIGSSPQQFAQFGDEPNTCRCALTSSCARDHRCNCDANLPSFVKDTGYFTAKRAGIIKATFDGLKGSSRGTLTLGPLQCTGDQRFEDQKTTFSTLESTLDFKPKDDSEGIVQSRVWFRTAKREAIVLELVEGDDGATSVSLSFIEGQRIVLTLREDDAITAMNTENLRDASLGRALSDNSWHLVEIQHNRQKNEVKVWRDFVHVGSLSLGRNWIFDKMRLGVEFTGCVSEVEVDNTRVDLIHAAASVSGVSSGCSDVCHPNPCIEGSCSAQGDEPTCHCHNHWAVKGKRCENDFNAGPSATITGRKSYLEYDQLEKNPVVSDLLLSFRTDQSSALVLYAHDHLYNFVQVALESTREVRLTLNDDQQIQSCVVHHSATMLDNLEWHQLRIHYAAEYTEFNVNNASCRIEGRRRTSSTKVAKFLDPYKRESVFPPRLPNTEQNLDPYTVLLVAGVPSGPLRYRRSDEDRTFYFNKLPTLRGCVRGLWLDEELKVALDDTDRHKHSQGIRIGCGLNSADRKCSKCANGGVCKIDWRTVRVAESECDCEMTSYTGSSCTDETGLRFEGNSGLSVAVAFRNDDDGVRDRRGNSISFALRLLPGETESQANTLLAKLMTQNKQIHIAIFVTKQANIQVWIVHQDSPAALYGHLFKNRKYDDRRRHFFHLQFLADALSVTLDSENHRIQIVQDEFNSTQLSRMLIGYDPDDKNFVGLTGCLSNLQVRSGERSEEPFEKYLSSGQSDGITQLGSAALKRSACPSVVEGPPPAISPLDVYPPWSVPLRKSPYVRPTDLAPPGIPPTVEPAGDGMSTTTSAPMQARFEGSSVLLVLIVIILIVVIGLLVLLAIVIAYCLWKKRRNAEEKDVEQPAGQTLLSDYATNDTIPVHDGARSKSNRPAISHHYKGHVTRERGRHTSARWSTSSYNEAAEADQFVVLADHKHRGPLYSPPDPVPVTFEETGAQIDVCELYPEPQFPPRVRQPSSAL